ncbi:hypothetical protein EB796_023094 [Bugula neritina]|uniref:Uncharacterized protein n=1 Tax=Bugula neritina TaxID=10212 RepID=A0A7J7IXQ3_BUGNE|nr:hypothetical protein EB796_023094 [Bugula neritina]
MLGKFVMVPWELDVIVGAWLLRLHIHTRTTYSYSQVAISMAFRNYILLFSLVVSTIAGPINVQDGDLKCAKTCEAAKWIPFVSIGSHKMIAKPGFQQPFWLFCSILPGS